jgi:hypothetical protein
LQHRVAEETLWLRFVGSCRALPTLCDTWMMLPDGQRQRSLVRTPSGQLQ